jgi:hypothetical protein
VEFFITPSVRQEIVSNPLRMHEYAFSAVRLQKLLRDGVLKLFSGEAVKERAQEILGIANGLFFVGGKPLRVLHFAEAECMASGFSCFATDEKTARQLVEDPLLLKPVLEFEYGEKVSVNRDALAALGEILSGTRVLRSSEFLFVAAEKGFFDDFGNEKKQALHAALYALRRAGCSISFRELKEYEETP